MPNYTRHLLPVLTTISGEPSGTVTFPLNPGGPIITLEYITLVPAATAGTVTMQTSPDGGDTWDDMAQGGTFDAASTSLPARVKAAGRGIATHARLVFAGVATSTTFTACVSKEV